MWYIYYVMNDERITKIFNSVMILLGSALLIVYGMVTYKAICESEGTLIEVRSKSNSLDTSQIDDTTMLLHVLQNDDYKHLMK
jgi:hypothetical protein